MNAITFQSPGEILFSIGPLQIYWYGAMIALAFIGGFSVVIHAAKQQGISTDRITDLSTMLLVCGIVCARLYYVLFDWEYFSAHPAEIIMTRNGGLSIHGVIIGCFIALMVYTKIHKLNLLQYTDIYAYGLIIGQAIGRWGNFFNSEAYGSPTTLPVRVFIPGEGYCHPTFLYESVWNLIVFALLYFVIGKRFKGQFGYVTCGYLILYSAGRFFIEGLRLDNIYTAFGLHIAQYASLVLAMAGVLGLIMLSFKQWKKS